MIGSSNRIYKKSGLISTFYFFDFSLMICWDLIDIVCMYLPDFTWFETIRRQVSAKTTTSIESDRILTYTKPINRPVTIDHFLFSCIVFIPRFSFIHTNHRHDISWSFYSEIWMQSSMYEDKILFFYIYRKWTYPFTQVILFKKTSI